MPSLLEHLGPLPGVVLVRRSLLHPDGTEWVRTRHLMMHKFHKNSFQMYTKRLRYFVKYSSNQLDFWVGTLLNTK